MSDLVQDEALLPGAVPARLRALTPARVALGRTGVSQHTRDVLAFQSAHAQARDAVHARLDSMSFVTTLRNSVAGAGQNPVLTLHSAAMGRATYLQRPDLGRRLDEPSRASLVELCSRPADLAIIVADGLSALAIERHVCPLLNEFLPLVGDLKLAPVTVVEQGRVAIGDEIGLLLSARLSIVLIGERPGLSSPDSLGAYITWDPRPGRTDAERNCISNIRVEGLSYREAAFQIYSCISAARAHQLTGVALAHAPASAISCPSRLEGE